MIICGLVCSNEAFLSLSFVTTTTTAILLFGQQGMLFGSSTSGDVEFTCILQQFPSHSFRCFQWKLQHFETCRIRGLTRHAWRRVKFRQGQFPRARRKRIGMLRIQYIWIVRSTGNDILFVFHHLMDGWISLRELSHKGEKWSSRAGTGCVQCYCTNLLDKGCNSNRRILSSFDKGCIQTL